MAGQQYREGKEFENNQQLHERLKQVLGLDSIVTDGSTSTKADTIGLKDQQRIPISIKNAGLKNTQVHLTTLKQLRLALPMCDRVYDTLDRWLGTNDPEIYATWRQGLDLNHYEISHGRITSHHLPDWSSVLTWVQEATVSGRLPRLLLQSLDDEDPARYIAWNRKRRGGLQIVDTDRLVTWISQQCQWITMPAGTVLRCQTPDGLPIITWQMKGNREPNGYNHTPQFHLYDNWPQEFVLHNDPDFKVSGH